MVELGEILDRLWPTLVGGIAVYAAIREDIGRLKEQSINNREKATGAHERADHAHERIDVILQRNQHAPPK